jgi:hypothetical protein
LGDDDVPIKTLIENVITGVGFADTRAAKMDVDDILK